MSESSEDRGSSSSLGAIGRALSASVDSLTHAVDGLIERAGKSERRARGIAVAVVLDLLFTGAFALLYYNQQHTANELADTRSQVLCPMYATFLGSYNPTSRAAGEDRATYENVFAQLRDAYTHLACTTPLVPRPTSTPPTPTPH